MAKKKINLEKLGGKKEVIKQSDNNRGEEEQKIIEQIHKTKSGRTKRITIDVPTDQHARMKMRVFTLQTTIKDYVLNLVDKDLNSQ